ncbi:hypothetical protein PAPYR_1456 [Paratrimastix pyriformis]|uniref:t-SNARE coiled-coil homology domain-containing protein n=1 Tax=Paratrimastix pyriformis TaxID=342808 RepID=A0ABQ8URN9_9EUKA|nr:hypothetical protein PAPYR_1456 [Paratrimastix pyriformis]
MRKLSADDYLRQNEEGVDQLTSKISRLKSDVQAIGTELDTHLSILDRTNANARSAQGGLGESGSALDRLVHMEKNKKIFWFIICLVLLVLFAVYLRLRSGSPKQA